MLLHIATKQAQEMFREILHREKTFSFIHKDYQTSLFILPELGYLRKNSRGNYKSTGIGAGYMRSIIPKVYELNPDGKIEKIGAGIIFLLTSL